MPKFEAMEIVAEPARLDKYFTDRQRSYNTYDEEGNRVFVVKMTRDSFVKETRRSERCVSTTYVEADDGWNRVEGRVPLCNYELFDKQRNCVVSTHNEGLVIPSSGAAPRLTKRHRQEPVVLYQHKRRTFTRNQRKSYDDSCAYLSYSDEAMWSQLKPATMPLPLPRGCRALMMELFGLMVLAVTAAQLGWSVTRGFNDEAGRFDNRQAEDDQ